MFKRCHLFQTSHIFAINVSFPGSVLEVHRYRYCSGSQLGVRTLVLWPYKAAGVKSVELLKSSCDEGSYVVKADA